jgi:transcriptional regulator with XRE-family HTH domain
MQHIAPLDAPRYAAGMRNGDAAAEAWSRYVRRCVGDSSAKEVAARTGISESTVGNWLRGERFTRPDLWRVRDFARVLGRPVPQALIAAGFEESDFAPGLLTKPDPSALTTDELLAELRRRIPDEQPLLDTRPPESPGFAGAGPAGQQPNGAGNKQVAHALVSLLESAGYHLLNSTAEGR